MFANLDELIEIDSAIVQKTFDEIIAESNKVAPRMHRPEPFSSVASTSTNGTNTEI